MSDDGTREILRRLANEDSRLLVIDNPQRIIPAGLNAAIRAAHATLLSEWMLTRSTHLIMFDNVLRC